MLSNNFVSLRFNPPEHRILELSNPGKLQELRDAVYLLVTSLVTAQPSLPSDSFTVVTIVDASAPTGSYHS